MTALNYIRRHLEADYPVHAEAVLEKLNQRLLEEVPETESTNEFEGLFYEDAAPFFLCALVMQEAEIKEAESYMRDLWNTYYKEYISA